MFALDTHKKKKQKQKPPAPFRIRTRWRRNQCSKLSTISRHFMDHKPFLDINSDLRKKKTGFEEKVIYFWYSGKGPDLSECVPSVLMLTNKQNKTKSKTAVLGLLAPAILQKTVLSVWIHSDNLQASIDHSMKGMNLRVGFCARHSSLLAPRPASHSCPRWPLSSRETIKRDYEQEKKKNIKEKPWREVYQGLLFSGQQFSFVITFFLRNWEEKKLEDNRKKTKPRQKNHACPSTSFLPLTKSIPQKPHTESLTVVVNSWEMKRLRLKIFCRKTKSRASHLVELFPGCNLKMFYDSIK